MLGLTLDDPQLSRRLVTKAAAEKLDREQNRGEGVAQLMAKNCQELILRTDGTLELGGLTPDGLCLQKPRDGTREELGDLMHEPLVAIAVMASIVGETDRAHL